MSFETISIYRDIPIVNGYAQIPPNRDQEKTHITGDAAETAIAGSSIVRLSLGSGKPRGSKCGQQEFLRLPAITPSTWYATDPLAGL